MRTAITLICVFLITFSNKSRAQKMTAAEQQRLKDQVEAGHDPYFVESRDTVSEYGPDCITRDLLQDRKGNYWLATWMGIIKYDGKIFTNYTLQKGLIHFHAASCYEDKSGNLWFGTVRGGLYRYDGTTFRLFTKKDGLPDNSVADFAEDAKGNIWFATDNGLSRFDGKTFTNFTVEDGLPTNKVNALLLAKDGRLLVGCGSSTVMAADGGIMVYKPAASGVLFEQFAGAEGKKVSAVSALHQDITGNIWIGGFKGLYLFDGRQLTPQLDTFLTYYFTEDGTGNVWFTQSSPPGGFHPSTPNQILYRYDGAAFTSVLEKYAPKDFQIFGKIVDHRGDLYLGTMHGICRYDGKTFTYFLQ
jgi:ligand-binding sensor domain-containing protein